MSAIGLDVGVGPHPRYTLDNLYIKITEEFAYSSGVQTLA